MNQPLQKLNQWWQEAKRKSPLKQKSAVCVSTINSNGFPSGRFVDLKSVSDNGLIFCTNYDSPKALEINNNSKVAITIWWDHLGYQVRVIGFAEKINSELADEYWVSRSSDAKIATLALKQSAPIVSVEAIHQKLNQDKTSSLHNTNSRPNNWGGYLVKPISIEYLTFKESRLHIREFFTSNKGCWDKTLLQP